VVNKQTSLPRDPDSGYNTVPAADAVIVYGTRLADIANDDDTAFFATYNEPEPNGYTDNILLFQ